MEQMQYASEFEMEKVKTTIKQFYRDWSIEVMRGEEGRGRKGGGGREEEGVGSMLTSTQESYVFSCMWSRG